MRVIILTALTVFGLSATAYACSCVPPSMQSSEKIFDDAAIVVEAEVISPGATAWMTGRELGEQVATVRPAKFYKGALATETIMFSYSENTAACGIGTLKEGETRLFILNQQADRLVSSGLCGMLLPDYIDKLSTQPIPVTGGERQDDVEEAAAKPVPLVPKGAGTE